MLIYIQNFVDVVVIKLAGRMYQGRGMIFASYLKQVSLNEVVIEYIAKQIHTWLDLDFTFYSFKYH